MTDSTRLLVVAFAIPFVVSGAVALLATVHALLEHWRGMPVVIVPCPLCGAASEKVLYAGLPARHCPNPTCSCLFGGWSWFIAALPFNGVLFVYQGSYLHAVWVWARGREE